MIENYINKHTVMGMMSYHYIPFDNFDGFYKNKDRTKVVVFDKNYQNEDCNEINYYYILDKPEEKIKNMYSSSLLISNFDKDYFSLKGLDNKEMRETRNKWNKKIVIKDNLDNIDEVLNLIDIWDEVSGKKYRFNRHSGYDRSFFKKYYKDEKENLISLFFYCENKLVGYSIVSKIMENDNCFRYIIRKSDNSIGRNIGLYIDFKTFENIFNIYEKEFKVNWGSSSKNVLKYKKTKFPVFLEKKTWFYKKVQNDK